VQTGLIIALASARLPVTGNQTRFEALKPVAVTAKQFHEEEAIGKTYDLQVARRLLRYLKPYLRPLAGAVAANAGA